MSVSLPPDLAEWVDQQAAERDTDRETVLVQLLAAHQATEDLDSEAKLNGDLLGATDDLEAAVREIIAGRIPDIAEAAAEEIDLDEQVSAIVEDQLTAALDERLTEAIEGQLATVLDERLAEATQSATEQATEQVGSEIQSLESEFMEKIKDVRDRVIQVKTEVDGKAPADHDHPDLTEQLAELDEQVAELGGDLEDVSERLDTELDGLEADHTDLDETVADIEEKLQTVAHVVRDLRDEANIGNKRATSVEQLKRTAAEHGIDRAKCETCGEGVSIALLTDSECPHCDSTVTDIEPSDGFFGSAKLVKATGIEPGDDEDE